MKTIKHVTRTVLTVLWEWSEEQYVLRNGQYYRRTKNGGWGGARDYRTFFPTADAVSDDEMVLVMMKYGLEDRWDAGETGMVIEVGR